MSKRAITAMRAMRMWLEIRDRRLEVWESPVSSLQFVMNDETQPSDLSRRRFLALVVHGGWAAALGVLAYQVGRFLGTAGLPTAPSPWVTAGQRADFPPGSTTYVGAARAWVRSEADGLTALDAVCPHLGCLVQRPETAVGFHCPCHGSEFGLDGTVLHGPAERPLRPLTVRVSPNDTVTILT